MLAFFAKNAPCLVGIEACGSAHHWARELSRLSHQVRLIPPSYVKPYVKRQKNDMADAEAICEAVTRPSMRFVPVKSPEQQSIMVLHRTRSILVRQRRSCRTPSVGTVGVAVAPIGRNGSGIEEIVAASDIRVPEESRLPADDVRPAQADQRSDP
jgi:transposase